MRLSRVWMLAGLAVALFASLFATGGAGAFDFWWWMAANAAVLTALSLALDRSYGPALLADLRTGLAGKIAWGLASAVALYGVFWLGDHLSRAWFGAWAGDGIRRVYDFKHGAGLTRIVLLLALLIGPAEEIFWRGFLQRRFAGRFGRWPAFAIATALYAGAHLASGNAMLVLAAVVCGVAWGLMYLARGSVVLNVVSHTAWDLVVFVVFPLGPGAGS